MHSMLCEHPARREIVGEMHLRRWPLIGPGMRLVRLADPDEEGEEQSAPFARVAVDRGSCEAGRRHFSATLWERVKLTSQCAPTADHPWRAAPRRGERHVRPEARWKDSSGDERLWICRDIRALEKTRRRGRSGSIGSCLPQILRPEEQDSGPGSDLLSFVAKWGASPGENSKPTRQWYICGSIGWRVNDRCDGDRSGKADYVHDVRMTLSSSTGVHHAP